MPDGLAGSQELVGSYDDEARLWTVTGVVAGLAGTSMVSLPGDVELDVDIAEGDRLSQLIVAAPPTGDPRGIDDAALRVVQTTLGVGRLNELFSVLERR